MDVGNVRLDLATLGAREGGVFDKPLEEIQRRVNAIAEQMGVEAPQVSLESSGTQPCSLQGKTLKVVPRLCTTMGFRTLTSRELELEVANFLAKEKLHQSRGWGLLGGTGSSVMLTLGGLTSLYGMWRSTSFGPSGFVCDEKNCEETMTWFKDSGESCDVIPSPGFTPALMLSGFAVAGLAMAAKGLFRRQVKHLAAQALAAVGEAPKNEEELSEGKFQERVDAIAQHIGVTAPKVLFCPRTPESTPIQGPSLWVNREVQEYRAKEDTPSELDARVAVCLAQKKIGEESVWHRSATKRVLGLASLSLMGVALYSTLRFGLSQPPESLRDAADPKFDGLFGNDTKRCGFYSSRYSPFTGSERCGHVGLPGTDLEGEETCLPQVVECVRDFSLFSFVGGCSQWAAMGGMFSIGVLSAWTQVKAAGVAAQALLGLREKERALEAGAKV